MDRFETRTFAGAGGLLLTGDVGGDPSAPTVIFMHGGGQTRHSWGSAMRDLVVTGYRTINLDARGHGDSQLSSDGAYSLIDRSADLRVILSQIEGRIAVVGASMGGATALRSAAEQGSSGIHALILVDIVPNPSPQGVKRIKDFMRRHVEGFRNIDDAVEAVAAYNIHRTRAPTADGIRKNLRLGPDGLYKWHWDPAFLDLDSAIESDQLRRAMNAKPDPWPPALLIRGMYSDVVTDAGIEEFRSQIPQLEIFNVSQAGHMVAGDSNDAFNAGVIDYLQRHLPVAG